MSSSVQNKILNQKQSPQHHWSAIDKGYTRVKADTTKYISDRPWPMTHSEYNKLPFTSFVIYKLQGKS